MGNDYWIGYACFNQSLVDNIDIKQLQCQQVNKVLDGDYWMIGNGAYTNNNWYHIFTIMSMNKCKRLYLGDNNITMIKQITIPLYKRLRQLDLSYNQITNISNLLDIKAQKLQSLCLNQNLITSFKSLNKSRWGHLKLLYLSNNINQQFRLDRMDMSENVSEIYYQPDWCQRLLNQDINIILKCKAIKIIQTSNIFIKQKKEFKVLIVLINIKQSRKYIININLQLYFLIQIMQIIIKIILLDYNKIDDYLYINQL